MNSIDIAKEVFKIESEAIKNLSRNLTGDFEKTVQFILESDGKCILIGMGKSGIIAKKIAATLASTGTPSFFMHPGEAYHGDLGMIEKEDVIILISNSGETDEVLKIIPFLNDNGNTIVSMSGKLQSTLAINTDLHLNIYVEKEACPLQLAPTSSTTATLVMGDALAVALMHKRNFKEEHFARFHPGGSLGRRLLTTVETVMRKDTLPICIKETLIKEVIHIVTSGKIGLVVVLDDNNIIGIITDGDIRRAMEDKEESFFKLTAKELMSENPVTIIPDLKLAEAEEVFQSNKINSLLVEEDKKLVGIIQMYDIRLMK